MKGLAVLTYSSNIKAILRRNMKLVTVLWPKLVGLSKDPMGPVSNWRVTDSPLMMRERLWCAILFVHRWVGMSTSIIVAQRTVYPAPEMNCSISMQGWFLIRTSPGMSSLTDSTGAGWVCWIHFPRFSCCFLETKSSFIGFKGGER